MAFVHAIDPDSLLRGVMVTTQTGLVVELTYDLHSDAIRAVEVEDTNTCASQRCLSGGRAYPNGVAPKRTPRPVTLEDVGALLQHYSQDQFGKGEGESLSDAQRRAVAQTQASLGVAAELEADRYLTPSEISHARVEGAQYFERTRSASQRQASLNALSPSFAKMEAVVYRGKVTPYLNVVGTKASFAEAFAASRSVFGPDGMFKYGGKFYSTERKTDQRQGVTAGQTRSIAVESRPQFYQDFSYFSEVNPDISNLFKQMTPDKNGGEFFVSQKKRESDTDNIRWKGVISADVVENNLDLSVSRETKIGNLEATNTLSTRADGSVGKEFRFGHEHDGGSVGVGGRFDLKLSTDDKILVRAERVVGGLLELEVFAWVTWEQKHDDGSTAARTFERLVETETSGTKSFDMPGFSVRLKGAVKGDKIEATVEIAVRPSEVVGGVLIGSKVVALVRKLGPAVEAIVRSQVRKLAKERKSLRSAAIVSNIVALDNAFADGSKLEATKSNEAELQAHVQQSMTHDVDFSKIPLLREK